MHLIEDKYNGITVDSDTIPLDQNEFKSHIVRFIAESSDKNLLWIKVAIERSELIPVLTGLGFEFHHCTERELTLVKKLVENPTVPTAKSHTLGVGAIVMDGTKLLVIKDRIFPGYKLPGGHVDPHETIIDGLKREVFEETGIRIVFESIANMGHFTAGQFGESTLYVVCTAKPESKEITVFDTSEIVEARWIEVDLFLNLEDTNVYNKKIVQTALENRDLKLTYHELPLTMRGPYELFF